MKSKLISRYESKRSQQLAIPQTEKSETSNKKYNCILFLINILYSRRTREEDEEEESKEAEKQINSMRNKMHLNLI